MNHSQLKTFTSIRAALQKKVAVAQANEQPRIKSHWSPCGRREVTQDYYTVRPVANDHSDYWSPRQDPDGVMRVRDTDEEKRQYLDDMAEDIEFINSLHPSRVLDFGAGLGWLLSALTRRIYKVAVEVCPAAAERCKEVADEVFSSLDDLDVLDGEFDVVVANHVIEHLPDPITAVTIIRRLLRPGGVFVVGTPDFESPCAKRFGANYRLLHDKTHCSLFSTDGLLRMLRDNGFTVDKVRFPYPERYATPENLARWADTTKVSPPWPGNFVTVYCHR